MALSPARSPMLGRSPTSLPTGRQRLFGNVRDASETTVLRAAAPQPCCSPAFIMHLQPCSLKSLALSICVATKFVGGFAREAGWRGWWFVPGSVLGVGAVAVTRSGRGWLPQFLIRWVGSLLGGELIGLPAPSRLYSAHSSGLTLADRVVWSGVVGLNLDWTWA